LVDVWRLHDSAYRAAGQTGSLVEKRRALVFMAWLALRVVHQTPINARSHITSNRRASVRVLLRSARELRSHEDARSGRKVDRSTWRGRYVIAIRKAMVRSALYRSAV
jgi:hypothetical protein